MIIMISTHPKCLLHLYPSLSSSSLLSIIFIHSHPTGRKCYCYHYLHHLHHQYHLFFLISSFSSPSSLLLFLIKFIPSQEDEREREKQESSSPYHFRPITANQNSITINLKLNFITNNNQFAFNCYSNFNLYTYKL